MTDTWLEAGIVSSDAASLIEFYEQGLGFETTSTLDFDIGRLHKLSNGRATMKIFQPVDPPTDHDRSGRWLATSGWAYAALHVDDIGDALARAEAAGAVVTMPVTNHRPGARMALFEDPQGNTWELLEEDD